MMNYVALYRKYRPKNFDSISGQTKAVKILKNSILLNRFSHAYLFFGPRGTGKTSIAKIVAKTINCDNLDKNGDCCNKCNSCMLASQNNNPDIIEIDAASNNGVDEIRLIREKANLVPSISKYKIYIIDEVHMLSTGAFNALLKTLEEPPKHAVFILATTEYNKVPNTILSRCQCIEFELISNSDIIDRLKEISLKENILVKDDVFQLIAEYSNGGLRDSINLLDKLISYSEKEITKTDFYDLTGTTDPRVIIELVYTIIKGNLDEAIKISDQLLNSGKKEEQILEEMIKVTKDIIIDNIENSNINIAYLYEMIDAFELSLTKFKRFYNSNIALELAIIRSINVVKKLNDIKSNKLEKDEIISREIISKKKTKENSKIISQEIILEEQNKNQIINNAFCEADKKYLREYKEKLDNFSDYLNKKDLKIAVTLLQDAELRVSSANEIVFSCKYKSLVSQAYQNILSIKKLIYQKIGKNLHIAFITDDEWQVEKNGYIKNKHDGVEIKYIEYLKNEDEKNNKIISREIILEEQTNGILDLFDKNEIDIEN